MAPNSRKTPKYKNRSERNAGYTSLAQELFRNKKILTERPDSMSFEDYKFLRTTQNLILKNIFSGRNPDRRLQGIMRPSQNYGMTSRGVRRKVMQRRAS